MLKGVLSSNNLLKLIVLSLRGRHFLRNVILHFYLNDIVLLMIKGTKLSKQKNNNNNKSNFNSDQLKSFSIEVKAFPGIWEDIIWKKGRVPGGHSLDRTLI